MPFVNDLIVLIDNSSVPYGYIKLDHDLNEGAGGRYLYFAYHQGYENSDSMDTAIRDIQFLVGDHAYPQGYTVPRDPDGKPYEVVAVDLNMGAGGKYIYTCFTRNSRAGDLISRLTVISGSSSNIQPDPPFKKINTDLNQGAGGKYIYLCTAS